MNKKEMGLPPTDYRQLYLDFLNETVEYEDRHGRGTMKHKNRVRYPKQYEMVETTPLGESIDLRTIDNKHRKIWVWSDQHFGHKNIIKYSNRPFADVDEMRETMIRNHNDVVGMNDYVIWVGDVAFLNDDKANEILHRLNGYKILIVGNHDLAKKKLKKLHVDEVHLIYILEHGEVTILFTHFPMLTLPDNTYNIHGHIHDEDPSTNNHFNVCVERINYRPVLLKSILPDT